MGQAGRPNAPLPPLILAQFPIEVRERFFAALAFQVLLQAPQGYADYVAMVQARSEVFLKAQPKLVGAVQILGP